MIYYNSYTVNEQVYRMDTFTFTYIFRNITGVSQEYADAAWFSLSDKDKCKPIRAGFIHGRDHIRWRNANG